MFAYNFLSFNVGSLYCSKIGHTICDTNESLIDNMNYSYCKLSDLEDLLEWHFIAVKISGGMTFHCG
jgi:hypothetical protein